jgi:hypothetical protein
MNRGKTKSNTSGYKGVNCEKKRKRKKYRAQITVNRKTFYLGNFEKADEAATAYRKAAKQHHGRFMFKGLPNNQ